MKSKQVKYLASSLMGIAFVFFVYLVYKTITIISKTQVSTKDGIYSSYVSTKPNIQKQAQDLTKNCQSTLCKVQTLLNFTSNIPYKTNTFQQNKPQKTIQENFGDCDDKSNLLISMLHALEIEAYFVLVPKHIFVIVPLEEINLTHKKGLWINEKKYYILESTAKDSVVGHPLKYKLSDIDVIIEPFTNKKMDIVSLEYKH